MATIEHHVTRELVALAGETSCADAARALIEHGIGSVAVRVAGRVIGLVTERDLVARVLAEGASAELPISEVMRHDLPRVAPQTDEAECAALMRDHVTRHLLVADGGEVVGLISMRDLLRLGQFAEINLGEIVRA